ncbi:tyrosine-type recombinase/integrase [Terrisporobacter petrolearius]|uniref:tyrosine-type recombinase/integrase n=1 Tax=Terrisporobacter petrolearius TaxID=1460447 RepID=UPI003AFF6575
MIDNVKSAFITKKRGFFYAAIDYYDENGKLKQKLLKKFEKKKDADKYLIDIKSEINNNKYITPSSITFVDRCKQYYNNKSKDFSPTTLKRSMGVINKHVTDFFKDTKLSDVNISFYQSFINYMYANKNLKATTIKEILMKTNAVLRECYRLREINENIPDFITVPKRKEPANTDVYTVDESKKILSESINNPKLELPLHLFLLAGLRFGEMAGLLWEDIDFENRLLRIKNNLVYVNGEYYLRETKTEGSNREIIVPDIVIDLLKKEKLRQNKLKLQGLLKNEWDVVCINSKYRYWNNESFRSAYINYIKSINLRYIHIHSLRHAHATMLLLAGTDMKTVSERLGHTEINITMNIYSHVLKEMDKKASDNIEKILL